MNGHPPIWKLILDTVLAAVGILMLIHETLLAEPRWEVMLVALIVLGFVPASNIGDLLKR